MIEVKNLCKSFEGREVLKDINTVFEDGKTNLIIGQSGSGKTVLMKNLVGLFEPTSGQVLYDGRDFVKMTKHEKVLMRREMGMIFQSAALFDSMTVLENVMFPLDMFSTMTLRERIHRAQECLDRVVSPLPVPSPSIRNTCSATSPTLVSTPRPHSLSTVCCRASRKNLR